MPVSLPDPSFDVDDLRLRGITALAASAFANPPQRLLGLVRTVWPNLRLPEFRYLTRYLPIPWPRCWVLVTRYADVAEVLSRHDDFNVAWKKETRALNGGPNFILGLDGGPVEGPEYALQLELLMRAFGRDDVERRVAPLARAAAERIVAGAGGRLDAVQALITRVPLEICRDYYGVAIAAHEMTQLAQWTIAISGYLFGPPFDRERPGVARAAEAGAARLRAVVDAAIDGEIARGGASDTVLGRLVREAAKNPKMTRDRMRAFLIGMIVGFVPTNTVAGGHILDVLLTRRTHLSAARAAALAGDDALLARCLFEAMRYRPLNPGPWRVCARDATIAAGTWRATRVRAGTLVLASTQSAMFDPRQVHAPRRYDPRRAASDSMLFGYGLHWCAGRYIAEAQIAQTLKALLVQPELRRAPGEAGRLRLLGLFPEHLEVEFG